MADTVDTAGVARGAGCRRAAALREVRAYVRASYAPGDRLAPLVVVARQLGLPHNAVRQALRRLDTLGEVAICPPRICLVLGPGDVHPNDFPLLEAVAARIEADRYRSGQALPTGLLGDEFALPPEHVGRACAHLLAQGLVRRDAHGPYGPGYYVV